MTFVYSHLCVGYRFEILLTYLTDNVRELTTSYVNLQLKHTTYNSGLLCFVLF
jgi:hypothetical protein